MGRECSLVFAQMVGRFHSLVVVGSPVECDKEVVVAMLVVWTYCRLEVVEVVRAVVVDLVLVVLLIVVVGLL